MRPLVVLLVLLSGCPDRAAPTTTDAASATSACTRVGESCTFSAGKLGTCVSRDDCAAPPCLVCQSQH